VILFLGAEFTQVYARQKRGKLEPKKYAVPVKEQERAEEGMPHDDGKKGSSVSEPGGKGRAKHWEGAPVYAMKDHKPDPNKPGRARELGKIAYAPLERVEARPWSFVGLALATGLATGVLMRHKWLRKGLKAYLGSRGMG
jgi:hypothetical protein